MVKQILYKYIYIWYDNVKGTTEGRMETIANGITETGRKGGVDNNRHNGRQFGTRKKWSNF